MIIRRVGLAAVAAGVALAGLSVGTAVAAPDCADVHFIGAAGSGQRDGVSLAAYNGMGDVVHQSYQQLRSQLVSAGHTVSSEAIRYPAAPVPEDGSLGGWMDFMGSVRQGAGAAAEQYHSYVGRCPASKVVLAGYSQGAMAVHRTLHNLADSPQLAAVLLVADGDRIPDDTTIKMGSTALAAPGKRMGVAQEHYILAGTNTDKLPATLGSRTISVCDIEDPVCDYDPDISGSTPRELAIHTGYAPKSSGLHAWGGPLYSLVAAALPDSAAESLTFGPESDETPTPGAETAAPEGSTLTRLASGRGD